MTGILGAMQKETEQLKELVENKKISEKSGIEFVSGTIGRKDVIVATCFPGKVNAALCTQVMIDFFDVDEIINIGVAGSLDNDLDIGDVAIGTKCLQTDVDTTAIGDSIGFISGICKTELECDEDIKNKLIKSAALSGIKYKTGKISCSDRFVASRAEKDGILKNFDCIACEMESGAIAHVCYVNSVPFAVVRSISDKADESAHMDYPSFVKIACKNSTEIIKNYLSL